VNGCVDIIYHSSQRWTYLFQFCSIWNK